MAKCDIYRICDGSFKMAATDFIGTMETLIKEAKARKDSASMARAEGATNIANEYSTPGLKYFAWSSGDGFMGLAGLMILSTKVDSIKVEDICTHPGSKGVGVKFMQFAVRESVKLGKGGVLTLTDMSGSKFYDNLGFKPYVEGDVKSKRLSEYPALSLERLGPT